MPEFFIRFLTEPGQLVLDPFAGSNMTGHVAERLERRWLSIEINADYVAGSRLRFDDDAHDFPTRFRSSVRWRLKRCNKWLVDVAQLRQVFRR